MAKTNHALVFDLNLTCKLKLEVKYYALVSVINLTCKLNVACFEPTSSSLVYLCEIL